MASRNASTAPRSTGRAAGKTAAKSTGAAQHANAENLKDTQPQGGTQTPPTDRVDTSVNPQTQTPQGAASGTTQPPAGAPQTNDADLKMPHIQHGVLVTAMKASIAGFKNAITREIAVCVAVFAEAGDTSAAAKKELYAVFNEAGYDCKVGGEGKDYKTVNRHIGFADKFFNHVEATQSGFFKGLMGEARDDDALMVLHGHIATKYNFRDWSDVQEASGIVIQQRTRSSGQQGGDQGGGNAGGNQPQGNAPQGGGSANEQSQSVFHTSATANPTGTPQGQPSEAAQGVMNAMDDARAEASAGAARREFDDASKWMKFSFEGATIVIPHGMRTECLTMLGIKLMTAANNMHGAHTIVAAALNEQFKELAAAH